MQNNRRQFFIYDLEIAARKAGATIPTMATVAAVWERMKVAGRTHGIRSNSATLLIGDIDFDHARNFMTLLVRLSDKNAPNSVYSDHAAGHYDEHVKHGNIGSDFGCHVLISMLPERNQPNVYTSAIERIPGLPPELVRRLLSKLLSFEFHGNSASFEYPDPAGGRDRQGNVRMERCRPHIELRARPSETFINDINNGRLTGVTLVKAEQVTPIAGAAYLRKETSELKLSIDHNNLPAQLWDSLSHVFSRNAQTYRQAKVAYKIPNSNRTVTVEFDAATGSPLNELYILSFELTQIVPFLAQSARSIVPHLRDRAFPFFLQHRSV